ncbi:MAG: ankyrin repeat domain-containing protein [Candidatus Margulisbacteria bacterium]|nr:ankyrin repeat domain-containing protein [Candidatus Margulisiibacteriota bacterium]
MLGKIIAQPKISGNVKIQLRIFLGCLKHNINPFAEPEVKLFLEMLIKIKPEERLKIIGKEDPDRLDFLLKKNRPATGDTISSARISIWTCLLNLNDKNSHMILDRLIRDFSIIGYIPRRQPKAVGHHNKELMEAIKNKNEELVRKLIEDGADINFRSDVKDEDSAIIKRAFFKGNENIVLMLLEAGVNLEGYKFGTYNSLLIWAIENNHKFIALYLLNRIVDVNIKDAWDNSTLICAIEKGDQEIIDLVLDHKPKLGIKNRDGNSALMLACKANLEKTVERLLKNKINLNVVNNSKESALIVAVKAGNYNIVKMLIQAGANYKPRDHWGTALQHAADKGNTDIVKLLLNYCSKELIDNNYGDGTALIRAAEKGYLEIIKLLVNAGADLTQRNSHKRSALDNACFRKHFDIVKYLIDEKGISVEPDESNDCSPFMYAALSGHLQITEYLFRKGANIHKRGYNNWTALFYAAMNLNKDVVLFLINNGAKVNELDTEGLSPLSHTLSYKNCLDTVRLLIDHGAEVNLCGENTSSPLERAIYYYRPDAVELLLKHKADRSFLSAPNYEIRSVAEAKELKNLINTIKNYK